MLCEYGCGQEAKYQFGNGKWCCESHYLKCSIYRKKRCGENNPFFNRKHTDNTKKIISEKTAGEKNPRFNIKLTTEIKKKISKSLIGKMKGRDNPFYGKSHSKESREKMSVGLTFPISYYKEKYLLFSKIEKMRYNPNKPDIKEIQVHCKFNECKNSKENNGWFTPSKTQFYERIRVLEVSGIGGSHFYCSDSCKQKCPLFNLRSDPNEQKEILYSSGDYQIWRTEVLFRSDNLCEYCGEIATDCHHSRPQKLEPGFVLDPDFGIACCQKCHYKYGHKTRTECSTGNLANKICK